MRSKKGKARGWVKVRKGRGEKGGKLGGRRRTSLAKKSTGVGAKV